MDTQSRIELAAEILVAFISNNSVRTSELSALLQAVHAAVTRLADGNSSAPLAIETAAPAVSIRKSITPDYLICLDDGKRFKSLRRHLAGLGMTPEQYRAKWNLPLDYPMVAANSRCGDGNGKEDRTWAIAQEGRYRGAGERRQTQGRPSAQGEGVTDLAKQWARGQSQFVPAPFAFRTRSRAVRQESRAPRE